MARSRSRTTLPAIALGVMVVATFAPPTLAFYRCRMMATTMSSPCCGQEGESRSSETTRLQAERCCSKVTVSIERAPFDLTPKRDGLPQPPSVAAPASSALVALTPAPVSFSWTRAEFDAGPPIILRVCSLLI